MQKNAVSVVAIILSAAALSVTWLRKDIETSSLTLKSRSGHVYAVLDANHEQFTLYDSHNNAAVDIQVTGEGSNVIVHGADGFERIRLSTWASEAEGSYIHILHDGWQKDDFKRPSEAVNISKNGVKAESVKTREVTITKEPLDPFADRQK